MTTNFRGNWPVYNWAEESADEPDQESANDQTYSKGNPGINDIQLINIPGRCVTLACHVRNNNKAFTLNSTTLIFFKRFAGLVFFNVVLLTMCFGQQSLTPALERLFNKIESDILTTAEAMPEAKFNFSPEGAGIKNSSFRGVRTFAGQILHLATDNIFIWSAITGDAIRADIEDVNGPKTLRTKKDIIEYLKNSFAIGRKAIATLTDQNAMDQIDYRWRKLPRLDLAFYALTHSNEHYGQMVVYLRMCGITPPPTLSQQ